MRMTHVARAVFDRPWAILPTRLEAMVELLQLRMAGGRLDENEIRERLAAAAIQAGPRGGAQPGTIALIPIYGVLSHRMSMMSEVSGGTSVQQVRGAFRQALADPAVTGILFDVDSPGGSVEGIPEMAAEIRAARGQKPMVAISNTLMASAAYWLASQADELVASPSALTGSIGVYMPHEDVSGANEADGVKVTYISAGAHKLDGNPDEPLTDDARGYLQGLVDATYDQFTADVSKGRGVSVSTARGAAFGEGHVLTADDAKAAGMVDRVGTFDDAVGRLARGKVGMRATFLPGPVSLIGATDSWVDITDLAATEHVELNVESGEQRRTPLDPPPDWSEPDGSHAVALARARARQRRIPA